MNPTFISVSGFGYSGSGAVLDLLKEFEFIDVIDNFEFQIIYFPDGILDLENKLLYNHNRFYDGDIAINRFLQLVNSMDRSYNSRFGNKFKNLSRAYIQSLIATEFNSYWAYDYYHLSTIRFYLLKLVGKLKCKKIFLKYILKNRPIYISINPTGFVDKTKKYLSDICLELSQDKSEFIVFDQALPPNYPEYSFKFFDQAKAIVVDRDPRDLYIYSKLNNINFIPTSSVDKFIIWYRENLKKEVRTESDLVLQIHFEDLIYNYLETVKRIVNYCNLGKHREKKVYFNPSISIKNTQLFLKHKQFLMDVKKIERELSDFLFDFSIYSNI